LLRGSGTLKADDAADFEKLARVAMAIATKLRLTPQSRTHPEKLARMQKQQPLSYYEREALREQMEADGAN